MRVQESDLYYEESGEGVPILLIHAGGSPTVTLVTSIVASLPGAIAQFRPASRWMLGGSSGTARLGATKQPTAIEPTGWRRCRSACPHRLPETRWATEADSRECRLSRRPRYPC